MPRAAERLTMSSWSPTRSISAIIRSITCPSPSAFETWYVSGKSIPSSDVAPTGWNDERIVPLFAAAMNSVGAQSIDRGLEPFGHLGHGEPLGEGHLGVGLSRRGPQAPEHVAHVIVRPDLVVARDQLDAAFALDVPLEHAGVGDQARRRRAARRSDCRSSSSFTVKLCTSPGAPSGLILPRYHQPTAPAMRIAMTTSTIDSPDDPLERTRLLAESFDLTRPIGRVPRIARPVERRSAVGVDLGLGQQRVEVLHVAASGRVVAHVDRR